MKALLILFALSLCSCASDAIFHEVVDVECPVCHARPLGLKPVVRVSYQFHEWTRVISDYTCPNCNSQFRKYTIE